VIHSAFKNRKHMHGGQNELTVMSGMPRAALAGNAREHKSQQRLQPHAPAPEERACARAESARQGGK